MKCRIVVVNTLRGFFHDFSKVAADSHTDRPLQRPALVVLALVGVAAGEIAEFVS